jgi:YD repeat-containing protein
LPIRFSSSVLDVANNATTCGYDTESNLTSITDASNHSTQFQYDANRWVTQTTFPSTHVEQYSYDLVGNLTRKTDPATARRKRPRCPAFLADAEPTTPETRGQERVKKLAFGDVALRSGGLALRTRHSALALVRPSHGPVALRSHLEAASGCNDRRRAKQRIKL